MTESIPIDEEGEGEPTSGCVQEEGEESKTAAEEARAVSRREKRKAAKKEKRKQIRKELAEKARAEEEARLNDPEEQRRIRLEEEREKERLERERKEFEERERLFLEELARKRAEEEQEEEERRKFLEEESKQNQANLDNESNEDDDWEYVEEGPPEIIWQGNEIIVKKKRVKVKKKNADNQTNKEDADRPTSNPLPPQSEAFADFKHTPVVSAQQLLDNVAQQVPNFGTEQDKAHCPFHIKTGACRFGSRCSRVHFYPDKSCTLLFKNMYNGPGLAWEQDEGLEHTDEEVERCYEEFYEDVHTELLKFGEIVNFKVCRNGSFHLRGNVYVHYKSLESAVLAYHSTNARYFAGKQVNCEFVSVTRWKVAICGEYMKSRFKTCSRGTACNFIHCFRNPGGDYEWADWDKPPPKHWTRKMVALFGYSDESMYDKQIEHEGSGQMRNSNRMLTADRDRYYSRRSQSRERDSFNASSSRSRHEEHDSRRSSHRERHTSHNRKRLKTPEEKIGEGEINSEHNQHDKNRTPQDTDSDGDWSDRGREVNKRCSRTRKSSRHQDETSDSDGDFLDEERERGRRNKDGKRSPGKRNEFSKSPIGHRESRSRTHNIDYAGDRSDGGREVNKRHSHTRKSSRHQDETSDSYVDFLDEERERGRRNKDRERSPGKWNEFSESPNGHRKSRSRTHNSDYAGDRSDGDRYKRRSRRREGSRNSKKSLGLSDDHGDSEKINQRDSDSERFDITRVKRCSRSTKWDHSSIENNEADSQDIRVKYDRYYGQSANFDLESTYDRDENIEKTGYRKSEDEIMRKHKRSKRKLDHEDDEPGSPERYNRRSKSRDSEYDPNGKDDERDRWEPERNSPEIKHKSRSRGDGKEFEGKSKHRNGETRSRRSRRSSHGKNMESLDKMDST